MIVLDRADRVDRASEALGPMAKDPRVSFAPADIRDADLVGPLRGCGGVFHLAASADVRAAEEDPRAVFEDNVLATARLLDAMAETGVSRIGFPSTSTVYGEATVVPTPEDYAPLAPISVYGASKVAGEGLLHGFAARNELRAVIWRLANVVGAGATHGVVYDLVRKIRENPREIELLGREPGTRKSYVHIDDVLEAMLRTWDRVAAPVSTFNVGSEDAITVKEVADAVCRGVGAAGVRYRWSGGVGGGGWKGDVRTMALAIDRLKALGWRPRDRSAEAVARAAKELSSR